MLWETTSLRPWIAVLPPGFGRYAQASGGWIVSSSQNCVWWRQNAFASRSARPMLADRRDIDRATTAKVAFADHRSQAYLFGLASRGPTRRAGSSAGAGVLPESWLMQTGGGVLRKQPELLILYKSAGISSAKPLINFCSTGHLATLGWFVSSEILGNKRARLYDGAMADRSNDSRRPVQLLFDGC